MVCPRLYPSYIRDQFTDNSTAGQLLNIPVVTSSTHTNSYEVNSNEPSSIQNGKGVSVHCDEIHVAFNHDLTFKAPLPKSAKTITLDTTLHIYSDARTGKIVQLKDRPQKEIEDRGLIPDVSGYQKPTPSSSLTDTRSSFDDSILSLLPKLDCHKMRRRTQSMSSSTSVSSVPIGVVGLYACWGISCMRAGYARRLRPRAILRRPIVVQCPSMMPTFAQHLSKILNKSGRFATC